MSDLYEALGVAPDATPEEIKKAYRKKAKETHPDAGGSNEEFEKVNKANLVLSDPERRERYDSTGEADVPPLEMRVRSLLDELVTALIDQDDDILSVDLVEIMRQQVRNEINALNDRINKLSRKRDKADKLAKKFKKKAKKGKAGANLLSDIASKKSRDFAARIKKTTGVLEVFSGALEALKDYTFDQDKPPPPKVDPWGYSTLGTGGGTSFGFRGI